MGTTELRTTSRTIKKQESLASTVRRAQQLPPTSACSVSFALSIKKYRYEAPVRIASHGVSPLLLGLGKVVGFFTHWLALLPSC